SLMLRSPLDRLHLSYPDLASRLQTVAKQLQDASSNVPASQAPTSAPADLEHVGQLRRCLAKEYNDLLTETRKLSGFEDFLWPMKASTLVHATRNGPIVVINCHDTGCEALLILPGQDDIQHLPLPNFTKKQAQTVRLELGASLRRKGLRQHGVKIRLPPGFKNTIDSVLLTLWTDVVKPVLDFLGLTVRPKN
ncbi:hypothetical protein FRC11_013566, partial [Ceratobasidium sp. 423]